MIRKILIICFLLFSFITQTLYDQGEHLIFSRLTIADVFAILALFLSAKYIYGIFREVHKFSNIYWASIFMVLCLLLPVFFSLNIKATFMECGIIIFLMLVSLLIFDVFKESLENRLFPLFMIIVIVSSLLGIYNYLALSLHLPILFPPRASGEILSGFRSAGQAGEYYLVFITILFPVLFSKLYWLLSSRNRKLLIISLIIGLVFFALTIKIASSIGLFIGFLLFLFFKRNRKVLLTVGFIFLCYYLIFASLQQLAPKVHQRFKLKFQTRVVAKLSGDINESDFIVKNIKQALQAFKDNPISGTGLGGFRKNYGSHEVHSTYFKILGETGILGNIGYGIFIFYFLRFFKQRKSKQINPYYDYLNTMIPFMIGNMFSWFYTYHLRKREFWILIAVLLIVTYLANNIETQRKKNTVDEISKVV